MIRLKPIAGTQSFYVIPSTYEDLDLASSIIYIENEESDVEKTYSYLNASIWSTSKQIWNLFPVVWNSSNEGFSYSFSENGNYLILSITSLDSPKEGSRYKIEMKNSSKVVFRDLIFVTEETDKKQVYSSSSNYKEYSNGDSNYIVL